MYFGSTAICYREERFILPHLQHLPDWIDPLVLVSTKPWTGEDTGADGTAKLAKTTEARVVENYWKTEDHQRNVGQVLHDDKDWIIVLDPDEFLTNDGWDTLKNFLETTDADAVIVEGQYTYWKDGYVADPPRDYQQLIAVRPNVRFVDKRVVGSTYVVAPVWIHHFSWARTDAEVWDKISHYAHSSDFDITNWYENVWLKWKPGIEDVHPTSPETLHKLIKATLPPELESLNLWPKN